MNVDSLRRHALPVCIAAATGAGAALLRRKAQEHPRFEGTVHLKCSPIAPHVANLEGLGSMDDFHVLMQTCETFLEMVEGRPNGFLLNRASHAVVAAAERILEKGKRSREEEVVYKAILSQDDVAFLASFCEKAVHDSLMR